IPYEVRCINNKKHMAYVRRRTKKSEFRGIRGQEARVRGENRDSQAEHQGALRGIRECAERNCEIRRLEKED
ncbi:unnamed protein product, partial [Heterotrigona itama]